jgi:hypothetical protein
MPARKCDVEERVCPPDRRSARVAPPCAGSGANPRMRTVAIACQRKQPQLRSRRCFPCKAGARRDAGRDQPPRDRRLVDTTPARCAKSPARPRAPPVPCRSRPFGPLAGLAPGCALIGAAIPALSEPAMIERALPSDAFGPAARSWAPRSPLGLRQLSRLGQLGQARGDRVSIEPPRSRDVARGGAGVRSHEISPRGRDTHACVRSSAHE